MANNEDFKWPEGLHHNLVEDEDAAAFYFSTFVLS